MTTENDDTIGRTSSRALYAAMRVMKQSMPEATESGRLLVLVLSAVASCGMLGVERKKIIDLVSEAHAEGFAQGPLSSLFD